MKQLLLLVLFVACAVSASAQVDILDARGLVGGRVQVPVVLYGAGGESTVRGVVKLSNPTVFYPEQFAAGSQGELLSSSLTRVTDSTWNFELSVRYDSADTVCLLVGEALAGSDSLCTLMLQDVTVDTESWPEATAVVSVTSVGPPLPYVRFARLEQNYPNPAVRGQATTWVYRIDKASAVRLELYDVGGRLMEVLEPGLQKPGVYRISYQPPATMATGLYWAWLVTGSGLYFQPFVVVP